MTVFLEVFLHVTFVFAIAYYFMSAMQWYHYKIERVIFHYHRYTWHGVLFLLPIALYYVLVEPYVYGVYILYPIVLFFWNRKNDKKLVLTARVKRYFLFLFLALLFQILLCLFSEMCYKNGVLVPIFVAHFISLAFEKMVFLAYKKEAERKISKMNYLKIVAITASYGKTSIKNFLAHILASQYKVYATPRSVNTLGGIIKDINEDLKEDTQIYIVEAGARLRGDINEIAQCIHPHVAVVSCIGEQHIEYFKTLENIRNTKMELLNSSRLEKAFVHESATIIPNTKVNVFGEDIVDIQASLEGTSFSMVIEGEKIPFTCKLLGAFNAINIAAAIHVARHFGLSIESIQKAIHSLKGVSHRLEKIEAGGKLIVDDSFNGNLEGMLSSYNLMDTYTGRKVIITPGIIESTPEANALLAEKIDSVFDLVFITGKANQVILDNTIQRTQKIIVTDKSQLQTLLAEHTQRGDLILFSNDAPSFV